MSELMSAQNNGRDFRRQLLTTVSALALLAGVYGSDEAQAEDQGLDRPTVWIELGGQLERMNDSQGAFTPPFVEAIKQANLLPPLLDVQKPSAYAIGGEGKISFQPEGSDWVFSASVLYGRSNASQHRHQQTANAGVPVVPFTFIGINIGPGSYYPSQHKKFADGNESQSERHTVLDFHAGKDVGLGIFGAHGSSVLSGGVRFAQFSSKANVSLRAEPDVQYPTKPLSSIPALRGFKYYDPIRFHDYAASESNQRSFRGLGPSLAWNASAPFAGSPERGEITFDWGMNAAILFGRQKVRGHHQTTVQSYYKNRWLGGNGGRGGLGHFVNYTLLVQHGTQSYNTGGATAHHTNVAGFNRMRSVTVPNFGGFAGVSFLYSNAKVSFGYRADFFFGAMDGGIDAAKKENRGFYGPFVNLSVGLGG